MVKTTVKGSFSLGRFVFMEPGRRVGLGFFTLMLACALRGQGTFQNLDFESATIVPIPDDPQGRVEFNSAYPSWVGYVGGGIQGEVLYNRVYQDTSGISIIDENWPYYFGSLAGVISGGYTAILQAGVLGQSSGGSIPADTTLSQTSLIPANAESLRFRAFAWPFGSVRVSLGGERLTLIPLSSGTNYTEFGADIRAWQGEAAQLDFTVIAQRPHVVNISVFLDAIQFSPEAIPEPGVLGLLGLGALFLGWRHKRSPL